MARNRSLFSLSLLTVLFTVCMSGCSSKSGDDAPIVVNVLTSEDYIYIDEDTGETLVDYFEKWYQEEYGKEVKVSYETTDTNETMYNLLKTGKKHYDLMCTSDYIVQKLARENEIQVIDLNDVPDYRDYTSRFIDGKLRTAFTIPEGYNEEESTYSVGYMWGTLGLIFNPEYEHFNSNVTREKAIHDSSSFNMLWDKDYNQTASIKDSMRDTFAVATMKAFDEETNALRIAHENGELSDQEFNDKLNKIFNFMCEENLDQDTLNRVKEALVSLKKNSFGLEVDSGKQDIVTGKVGINMAWSGDATNSMWEAEENGDVELVYSVPDNGSNIWFDAWVVPTYENRDPEVYDAAMAFINYLSTPENAALNMSYVGYCSFIAGDSVIDYIIDNFDARCDTVYFVDEEENYFSLYYEDENGEEQEFWFQDVAEDAILSYDAQLYYYATEDENCEPTFIEDTYNSRKFDAEGEEPDVDLTYYFEDTLDEYTAEDCLFYSDDNYYYMDDVTGELSTSTGGIFYCSYPDEKTITRCCIMEDYGENNKIALKLWEDFKSDNLPTAAWVIMIIEIALMLGGVIYYFAGRRVKIHLRKNRLENNK